MLISVLNSGHGALPSRRHCPISGVDHPELLDVAHVLSWSDYPEHRADLTNVLPLSETHHAAFDRELFTTDRDYRLRVNPSFNTQSGVLSAGTNQ